MATSWSCPGRRWLLALVLSGICSPTALAAEWQPVTTELLKTEKPGYGGLCGVVVDHRTGHVIINLSDRGFYRSEDQGKSWKRLGTQEIKGRTEWPGCLMLDPVGAGKTLVSALVYGSPIVVSRDAGASWQVLDKKSGHVDWYAVNWSDPEMKLIFTLKHESGDLLLRSTDGGKSFEEVGKGYGPVWVFDGQTAVVAQAKSKDRPASIIASAVGQAAGLQNVWQAGWVANTMSKADRLKPGLLRTTDGGKTFQPSAEYYARALPRWHKDTLYFLVEGALLSTTDKGASWKKVCDLKDGRFGPIFGKDGKHLFVMTGAGVVESTDGGASWGKPIAPPPDFKGISTLTWLDYDPVHDVLYLMKMTSELYRMERGK